MPFTEQIKRFALVPVEPGKEKDTDVICRQDSLGMVAVKWHNDPNPTNDHLSVLYTDDPMYPADKQAIAALGFPTEGQTEGEEA